MQILDDHHHGTALLMTSPRLEEILANREASLCARRSELPGHLVRSL
jgi:hypothetical protein